MYANVNDYKVFHPVRVDLLVVDSRRAREALSWETRKSFEELALMMVEADLNTSR